MMLRFMAVEAITARVDFPAPRMPVMTREASGSNKSGTERPTDLGGELDDEGEADQDISQWSDKWPP